VQCNRKCDAEHFVEAKWLIYKIFSDGNSFFDSNRLNFTDFINQGILTPWRVMSLSYGHILSCGYFASMKDNVVNCAEAAYEWDGGFQENVVKDGRAQVKADAFASYCGIK